MALYLSFSSMILAIVLLFFNWKINRNALFLALLMVLIATGQIRHYLILHATEPFWLAILVNNPAPLWCMIGPCLFFYVRSVLTDRLVFHRSDWLHTLPFWVSLVGTLPYLLTPFSYKIEVANLFIHDMKGTRHIRFNWLLRDDVNLLLRYVVQIGYALACLWMVAASQRKRIQATGRASLPGAMIISWLVAVSVFVLLIGVYYFVGVYVYFRNPSIERNIVTIHNVLYFNGVALTFFPALVLALPEILYGIPRRSEAPQATIATAAAEPIVPSEHAATPGTAVDAASPPLQELGQRVVGFLEREKPYLSKDFSIEDLADMIGAPRHHMYYCFKHILKTRFVNLRAELRVREAQRRILQADLEQTTFFAIGLTCGFASHTGFFRTFRELAGCSPGEFLEKYREQGRVDYVALSIPGLESPNTAGSHGSDSVG